MLPDRLLRVAGRLPRPLLASFVALALLAPSPSFAQPRGAFSARAPSLGALAARRPGPSRRPLPAVRARAAVRQRVDVDNFHTGRDLTAYRAAFGPRFTSTLARLTRERGRDAHWIDMGAGDVRAIGQYVRERGANAVRTTALAAGTPRLWARRGPALQRRAATFRGLFGRLLGQYRARDIGQADLITDYYGPASYAEQLDDVVYQYGVLLRPGGEAHLYFDGGTRMEGRFGIELFRRWLGEDSGFEIVEDAPEERAFHTQTIVLRRTEAPLRIPKLRLTRIVDGAPPARSYRAVTP